MNASWLDFLPPFLQGLLVAAGIGLVIGLEREHEQQTQTRHFAGLRTFPLIAILGFTVGFISDQYLSWLLPAVTLGIFLLIAAAYYIQAQNGNFGLTTELALSIAFTLGALAAFGHPAEALAVAVVTTLLLSLKEELHGFVKQITDQELEAFIKFFVMALLLLLVLPNQYFGPENLLHYRELGWIIILVSSISFAGYLMLKFSGPQRGVLLTALMGGLFSSTMIAWVFAARSRETPAISRLWGTGILLSSSVLYVRILLLTATFNTAVTWQLALPCLLMLAFTLLLVWHHSRNKEMPAQQANLPLGNPLNLRNALFFGLLYIAVTLFMHYSRSWLGEKGGYISGFISGIADMDAITISTAKWAKQADTAYYGANVVMVAAMSNTLFKFGVAMAQGHATMRRSLAMGFGAVLLMGLAWLLFRLYF